MKFMAAMRGGYAFGYMPLQSGVAGFSFEASLPEAFIAIPFAELPGYGGRSSSGYQSAQSQSACGA